MGLVRCIMLAKMRSMASNSLLKPAALDSLRYHKYPKCLSGLQGVQQFGQSIVASTETAPSRRQWTAHISMIEPRARLRYQRYYICLFQTPRDILVICLYNVRRGEFQTRYKRAKFPIWIVRWHLGFLAYVGWQALDRLLVETKEVTLYIQGIFSDADLLKWLLCPWFGWPDACQKRSHCIASLFSRLFSKPNVFFSSKLSWR